ncbi:MAG: hypothetical protein JOY82_23555 [Streptosporangiaceae bacterium]|nr:hypothetical protein [Streptosporangiaceae bacterium]MBV9857460.1 hypothetical protein [Streptosporangiaceae bacterium]
MDETPSPTTTPTAAGPDGAAATLRGADIRARLRRPLRGRAMPWLAWAGPTAALLAVACVRNRFLFATRLYEDADMGANSILVEQARRFTLLTGNYSRELFDHPGPAYMYVKAAGESLAWAATRLVPTAWNGQLLAVYALNATLAGLVTYMVYGWTRSARGAFACFAVLAAFAAAHPAVVTSDWMPYLYVMSYLTFMVAAASVAAGHSRDDWVMALAGWFLIHGHVCFLFFVPLITCAVLLMAWWRRRRTPLEALRPVPAPTWVMVAVISAVFALPIAVNLALHWPGPFGDYLAYLRSGRAGGDSLATAIRYALWFWWPHPYSGAAPILAYLAAAAVIIWPGAVPLRPFLVALLAVNAVSSLAFVFYARTGIDTISSYYIGYFYWSAPVITLLVIAVGIVQRVPARLASVAAAAAAAGALTAFALAPQTQTSINSSDPSVISSGPDTDPALPGAVATLAARAGGRTIVLGFDQPTWPDLTGFLVQAERTGVRACVPDPAMTFMVTRQFICTNAQAAGGVRFYFHSGPLPGGTRVLVRLRQALVTTTHSGT